MPQTLSRRQKRIAATIASAVLFVVAVGLFLLLRPEKETYLPGSEIAGLTDELSRSVPDDAPRVQFTDVAAEAGIDFTHFSGRRTSQLPEDMGSGAAWGDYDSDGWQDLYVVNVTGPLRDAADQPNSQAPHNVLYHNNGDGTFTDVSIEAGVGVSGWGSGAAWGDYDRDGWIDLYTTSYGQNHLFHNGGDGTFTDVSQRAGVAGTNAFWAGVSWADYDRDGWLDLYVTGYVKFIPGLEGAPSMQYDVESPTSINPSSFEAERNMLFRNNGDGTFKDVAADAGVDNTEGRSLSAAWADFDGDGWSDLYVANDVSDNVFFQNLGDGTFQDISHLALVADYRGAMGLAVGDWNGDLDLDLLVTHWIAQENALYDNLVATTRPGASSLLLRFMDVADRHGLGQSALDYVGWGTSFFDYDNDGRPDLFIANGSTLQRPDAQHELVPMKDILFWNAGEERGFFDVSEIAGPYFDSERVGRGAAFADYDNDGDVDIFVVNHSGRAALLKNTGHPTNTWLEVELQGRKSNPQGIGARVRVVAGALVSIQEVGSQASYLSQNSVVSHFGLGEATSVDTVEVTWPGGSTTISTSANPNSMILIVEGQSR